MPAWMVPLVVPILSLPVSLLLVLVVLLSVGTVSHLCRTAGCGAHIIYDWTTSPFVWCWQILRCLAGYRGLPDAGEEQVVIPVWRTAGTVPTDAPTAIETQWARDVLKGGRSGPKLKRNHILASVALRPEEPPGLALLKQDPDAKSVTNRTCIGIA